jgi:hypothetical protein
VCYVARMLTEVWILISFFTLIIILLIYIHENIKFSTINIHRYCKEQDLEIAAVKLKLSKKNGIALCVYRAPTGDHDYFLKQIGIILNSLYNSKT